MSNSLGSIRSPLQPTLVSPIGRPLGARGARWTPRNLGSLLKAWWSADRSDLITLNGSQVSHWLDIVAGYDATQAISGNRPVYSAMSFNGSPGVTFDGIDDYLELGSVPFPSAGSGSELWGLADQTALVADTNNRVIISYGGNSSNTQRRLYRSVVSGQNRLTVLGGDGVASANANVAAGYSGRHVGRGVFSATSITPYFDGTAGSPTSINNNTATLRTRIGAGASSSAQDFFQGVMRDVIVTGPLTVAQAALLETYLYNRRNP